MVELRDRITALIAPARGQAGEVAARLQARFGVAWPEMGAFTQGGGLTLARVAPHQVLAMRDTAGLPAELESALGGAAGVIDLSDARTGVVISGPGARERLMGLVPVDLHPSVMRAGQCVQTVMAHITVLVCQLDDTPSYELQCATSYRESFLHAVGG